MAKRNQKESAKRAGLKRKGVKRPPEVVEKMRAAASGRRQGFAERLKRALKMRGDLHPAYLKKVHAFYNYKTGATINRTLYQFCKDTGLSKGNVSRMIGGGLNSAGDWTIKGRDLSKIRPVNIKRKFSHPDHGEVNCTMTELQNLYGPPIGSMSKVIAGERKTCKGWSYLGPSLAPDG